ncbi:MAG: glycosyltransferase family 4 protein [Oscillospiraceae bacterium]|jgi:glycosyltransferase involved in cell wall biosynthesis|nr:glycosyltransferase family 4 protein [Oscillospiraceae bacterium]MCI1990684.1 glycosyltransferase family 4 protein [Oscillospiraceae bacterium]MCI2035026.1 glycosyltransferase family 4 protein [Oscillospiraceae bacterium]
MNIVYINHYAGSAVHGMEFRPYYMARRWAAGGHGVTVVASSFSHLRTKNPEIGGKKYDEQTIDGVRYFWIAGNQYQGNGKDRIRNMLSFLCGLYRYGSRIAAAGKPDVVIASSTYPLDIYPACHIARKYGAMLIYEVHDLWPLSPIELGGMSPKHPYIRVMQAAENYCYRNSDYVVSLLPFAKEHMVEHGMLPEKFVYIPNGIEKSEWEQPFHYPMVYREELKQYHDDGYFLIGYTGAHGVANALDSYVEAGRWLRDKKIKLLSIGPGPERGRLIDKAHRLQLDDVVEFLPPVRRDQVPELLDQLDALYIGLQRQPLFRFGVSPNKLMDYMMAGKPIIFAIDAPNDMVKEADCGISIPPEDSKAIADAAVKLSETAPEELEKMGAHGKLYILSHNEYDVLAEKFLKVFGMPRMNP